MIPPITHHSSGRLQRLPTSPGYLFGQGYLPGQACFTPASPAQQLDSDNRSDAEPKQVDSNSSSADEPKQENLAGVLLPSPPRTPVIPHATVFCPISPPRCDKTRPSSPAHNQEHEIVLLEQPPEAAIRWCARQEKSSSRRVVNIISDEQGVNRKIRYYVVTSAFNATNRVTIHEPFSHTCYKVDGCFKTLRRGNLWVVNTTTGAVVKDPRPIVSLKNREDDVLKSGIPTEIALLQKLEGKRGVVQLIGTYHYTSFKGRFRKVLVMPEYELGSLENNLTRGWGNRLWARHCVLPALILRKTQLDLLHGLEAIHAAKIVHQDIKPANLFIDSKHTGAIGDFGLATSLPYSESGFGGTRHYFSPEITVSLKIQPAQERAKALTKALSAANDVWALGLTFCDLLDDNEKPQKFIEAILGTTNLATLNSTLAFFHTSEDLVLADDPSKNLFPEPTDRDSFAHIVWKMVRPNPNNRISAKAAREKWEACLSPMVNQSQSDFSACSPKENDEKTDSSQGISPATQEASPITPGKSL